MHVNRQILHLVRDALVASLPGVEVHLDRVDVLPARRCPAVLVREADTGGAISQLSAEGIQRRVLPVTVSSCVALAEGYGEAAYELGDRVERLLGADFDAAQPLVRTLRTMCPLGLELRGWRMFMSGEGETAIAVLMHSWHFTVAVYPAEPDIAIT